MIVLEVAKPNVHRALVHAIKIADRVVVTSATEHVLADAMHVVVAQVHV